MVRRVKLILAVQQPEITLERSESKTQTINKNYPSIIMTTSADLATIDMQVHVILLDEDSLNPANLVDERT
jgi:hypothetical protein